MFKVGDTVVVTDDNYLYTIYGSWATANNFKGFKSCDKLFVKGIKGVVEVVAPHNDYADRTLLGIDCHGTKIIMGVEGVELVKPVYPNPPHKHAELIKAWADGAVIEFYNKTYEKWYLSHYPSWSDGFKYRIKPSEPTAKELAEKQLKELEAKVEEIKATIQDLD